jgi:hypothetical protein
VETRADRYAATRTAGEVTQACDDLAMTRAQAEPGSLTDQLAAAYSRALGAEPADREGFQWLS